MESYITEIPELLEIAQASKTSSLRAGDFVA
jgi:hypothetical protein